MSKKPSLASQSDTALIPADLGGVLDAVTSTEVAVVETSSSTPYVTFISTRSKKWPDLARQIAGLQDGDVVLVRPNPEPPVRLSPFRFFLLTGLQYWAEADDDGNLLAATQVNPGRGSDLQETFEALVFAFLPDGTLEPARMTLRTTKCGVGKDAARALAQAGSPGWGDLSPAHAQSLAMPKPWMRFVSTATTAARTSRSSGYKYVAANSTPAPTSANDAAALKALFESPRFRERLVAVRDGYDRRIAEVREVAGK